MTRRITWLVAATTSAVVVAFVIPLMFILAGLATDRATSRARQQAQSTATFVASLADDETLARAVELRSAQGPRVVVVRADGTVAGGGDDPLAAGMLAAVRRARADQAAFTTRREGGLDAVVPVDTTEGIDVVVASVTDDDLREGVARGWALVLGLGVGLVTASVVVAWRLGRRISVPVSEVAAVAHRLQAGDSAARAVPGGPPETAELGRALNALADRIHELVAAERENVADLGHRLRTPVTALRLDTELVTDPEVSARLREHVDHLQRSIDDVVREARRPLTTELRRPTDLTEVVAARVAFWSALAEDQGRRLSHGSAPGPAPVPLAREEADELLDTLLDNVFAHTPEGTAAQVFTGRAAGLVRLVVEDAGPGMARPWSGRGDSPGGSTGLGLAIVHRLAAQAGGEVHLGPSPLGGLRVQVDLPVVAEH